jgi:hypothetical protein
MDARKEPKSAQQRQLQKDTAHIWRSLLAVTSAMGVNKTKAALRKK